MYFNSRTSHIHTKCFPFPMSYLVSSRRHLSSNFTEKNSSSPGHLGVSNVPVSQLQQSNRAMEPPNIVRRYILSNLWDVTHPWRERPKGSSRHVLNMCTNVVVSGFAFPDIYIYIYIAVCLSSSFILQYTSWTQPHLTRVRRCSGRQREI